MNRTDNLVSTLVSKVTDLKGRQVKNGGNATDPQDFVTLSQMQAAVAAVQPSSTSSTTSSVPTSTSSSSRVFTLQKYGNLAIQTDCAGHLFILQNQKVSTVRADLETAPTGASFICKVYQNSSLWVTLTITATHTTVSAATSGLTQLVAGNYLRLDITQVGSTIPGANLTVTIQ